MGLYPDLPPLTEREERLINPLCQRLADALNENKKLRAALEEIAETIGYVEIRAIARKALAKEGK